MSAKLLTIQMALPQKQATPQSALLRAALSDLVPGIAVVVEGSHAARMSVYRMADRMGLRVTTRKLDGGRMGVWLANQETRL